MRGIKIALPGYNALTDTDPSHFSLFVDGSDDHVLVKEFSFFAGSIPSGGSSSGNHSLGYPPLTLGFVSVSAGEYQYTYGFSPFSDYRVYTTTSSVIYENNGGSSIDVFFVVFYDQI